jgi:hypothetical protein
MAMQLAALDILITKGGFAPESARAIGEAVDLEIERSRESLATGQQLTDTRLMLEGKLTDTRLTLEGKLTETRQKLEQKIEDFRRDLEQKIEAVRFELKAEIAAVLVKLEATKSEILRWMFVAMTGQTIVLVGLIRLLK